MAVQSQDDLMGTKAQHRCKKCNALRTRISRMTNNTTQFDGLKEINPEERVDFMRQARDLCNENLAKQMMESIVWAKFRKETALFQQRGEFQDEADVLEQYKDRPEILANIKANAHTMVDPVRLVKMVWLPKFSLTLSTEEGESNEKKRKLESETAVKRKPKAKKPKTPKAIEDDKEPAQEKEGFGKFDDLAKVKIPDAQKQRLQKSIPGLEDLELSFSTKITAATDNAFVPAVMLEKAKSAATALENLVGRSKETFLGDKAAKGEMKYLFEETKKGVVAVKGLDQQLKTLLDLASSHAGA